MEEKKEGKKARMLDGRGRLNAEKRVKREASYGEKHFQTSPNLYRELLK